MAEYRRTIDVYQGYNFKKDKQTLVGFITSMKIGDTTLAADQTCKDPMNPTSDLKVVAVMSDVMWETGVTDAVYLAGQVSTANRQTVALLAIMNLVDITTVFQFKVYEFDKLAKKYFLAFQSNDTDMNGLIEKRGEDLNITVADDPSTEVQSPANYAFHIGIKPQPSAQALHIATADQKNVVKAWGLAVG
jgi:hypothetical protein